MNNIYIYIINTVNKHSVDNAIQYNTQIHPRFPFRLFGNSDTVPVASPTPPPHAATGRAGLDSSPPSALPPPWDAGDPGAGHLENLGNWPAQMVFSHVLT